MVARAAPRGARGRARRRLQPHRRGRRDRSDALCLRGLDAPAYYRHDDDGTPRRHDGVRQLDQRGEPRGRRASSLDSLRYWVSSLPRRRLPLRPRPDARAARRRASTPPRRSSQRCAHGPGPARASSSSASPGTSGARTATRSARFPAPFREWNGRVPRHGAGLLARRPTARSARSRRGVAGSSDLFGAPARLVASSVNYVTSHDGFTLRDLVSLRREAQRGERRGRHRRHRRQPLVELRRGGRDRRRRRSSRCARASRRAMLATLLVAPRRPDAARRRRARSHPGRATTTPTARTTRRAGSTGTAPTRRSARSRSRAARAAPRAPRAPRATPARRAHRDALALRPTARRWRDRVGRRAARGASRSRHDRAPRPTTTWSCS